MSGLSCLFSACHDFKNRLSFLSFPVFFLQPVVEKRFGGRFEPGAGMAFRRPLRRFNDRPVITGGKNIANARSGKLI
jgi:hypothetical protein